MVSSLSLICHALSIFSAFSVSCLVVKMVALSPMERARKYRERLKNDPERYKAYKIKDNKRKKSERKSMNEEQRKEQREKCRTRVQRHRMKKQMLNHSKSTPAFKTPQSLGKAVSKAKRSLPYSPRKRKIVVEKLAKDVYEGKSTKRHHHLSGNKSLTKATLDAVKKFFVLDSISRQAPGIKDFVIIRSPNGKKTKLQKRHLNFPMKEAYSLFLKDHPNIKISFSKFCKIRPANVLLSSSMPRNVCLCQHHDNIKLLCDAIHKEIPKFQPYSSKKVDAFVCSSSNEGCMTSQCKECPKWEEELIRDASSHKNKIEWYQWERVQKVLPPKKGKPTKIKSKIEKVVKSGAVDDVIKALKRKMPEFLTHTFVKRNQSEFFEKKKANIPGNEAIVQIDFSENYTCRHQDEVQAAHWDQEQVTIFPVVVWTKNGCTSHAIISDDLRHDKQSVTVFLDRILQDICKHHLEVDTVNIFSDGPASQFKNKYMVKLLFVLQKKTGLCLKWHYFASGHGKGAVDGVGGTVKRAVWSAVATRKLPYVNDANSFAKAASELCQLSTKITLIPKKEIDELFTSFNISDAETIKGISKIHCVEPFNSDVVLKIYSSQQPGKTIKNIYDEIDSDDSCADGSDGSEGYSDDEGNGEWCSDFEGFSDEGSSDGIERSDEEEDKEIQSCSDGEMSSDNDRSVDSAGCSQFEWCCDREGNGKGKGKEGDNQKGVLDLPSSIRDRLCSSTHESYAFPHHNKMLVDAIMSGHTNFKGSHIIAKKDLEELYGEENKSNSKWLSNFIIDEYLKLVSEKSCNIKAIPWEVFERSKVEKIASELGGYDSFVGYDCVLIPCNPMHSHHWFLVAMFPKKHIVLALDSLPSNHVKESTQKAFNKCSDIITSLQLNCDDWQYHTNAPSDIPQQHNSYDCGVFVCLYARALVLSDPVLDQNSMPDFRKMMLLELHKKCIQCISPTGIQLETYYAFDYVTTFYIGRVMEITASGITGKFLCKSQKDGIPIYNWPGRDDIDTVSPYSIFYGPVSFSDIRPFIINDHDEIVEVFKFVKKLREARI